METMNYKMLIGGKFVEAKSGKRFDVINPATEQIVGSAPAGDKEDAHEAIVNAEKAFHSWKKVPAGKRARLILDLADALAREKERFARLLCIEHGKPHWQALEEIDGTLGYLRTAAEGAKRMEGDILPSDFPGEQIWIQKVPYGVTVGLVAWNFPVALAGRKIGPALVAGNTMVVKPPTDVPLAVIEFGKLALEVGIPPGVFNVVTGGGRSMGDALVRHPLTRLVTHTGSTAAGQEIIRSSADNVTDLLLELGGNAPFIVFEDADIEKAAEAAIHARFYNCGQVCTCNERMYLHEKIYDKFMAAFLPKVKAITLGDQFSGAYMGPKINKPELDHVMELLEDAVSGGAKVETGGGKPSGEQFKKGYWIEPTVLTGVTQKMRIVQEEIFGPVVPVLPFKSFEEVIQLANDCEYGLSAYIYTKDLQRVMRTVEDLEFGEIYVNRGIGELPQGYHTGMKKSGIAGEDGKYGLENYLHKKTYYVRYSDSE
ncbi:MAG: aldehyde dehydrogenase family protein [Spirochaetales bacterium]